MPVTVRYPLDFTCASSFGCIYSDPYPLTGYAPTLMVGHLDAAYPWEINVRLTQQGGLTSGSGFIACSFEPGITDTSGTSELVMSADAESIYFFWAFLQNVSTSIHYTGYLDVTYGDVEPPEPPVKAISSQFVTILG